MYARNQLYWLIVVNFLAPGSRSAFTRIRIRTQASQINADQCGSGSGSTTLFSNIIYFFLSNPLF
jgi:hypothetical protein